MSFLMFIQASHLMKKFTIPNDLLISYKTPYFTSGFVRHNATNCAFTTDESWVILNPIEQSIKRKIEAVGTPLKDWDIKINRGILTGCNEAFIIDEAKRQELIVQDPRSDEIIRPILRGRDIKRYGYEWAHLHLIATFPARHYDIEKYPAVKHYLMSFDKERLLEAGLDDIANNAALLADFCRQRLEQSGRDIIINGHKVIIDGKAQKARKKTGNKWFETQDQIGYWEDFSKPKIMYPNMTKYLPFYYDTQCFVQNDKSFMITGKHLSYLVAFLNSSLFKYCYRDSFPELQGGTRELRKIFFDKITVSDVTDEQDEEISALVEKIQKMSANEERRKVETLVDNIIFKIHGLSEVEIQQIGFIEIV